MYVTPKHLCWIIKILKARGKKFTTVRDGFAQGCPMDAVALTFDDGYKDNLNLGFDVFQKERVPVTIYVVTSDIGKKDHFWSEAGDQTPSDLLTLDELKRLADAGHEISSHSHEHRHHARLDPSTQKNMIFASHDFLRTHLGNQPYTFAYPYGSFNNESLSLVKSAGFLCAVTTKQDGVNTKGTNPFALYRTPSKGYRVNHYLENLSLLTR